MVVAYLRTHGWPDARRYLAGDGRQRHLGDVDAIPGVAIEVKDRAQSAWATWLRDVEDGNPRVTVVVRRTRGVPDVGAWPAVVGSVDDWLHRLDGVPPTVTVTGSNCLPARWVDLHGSAIWDDGTRRRAVVTFAELVRAARTAR